MLRYSWPWSCGRNTGACFYSKYFSSRISVIGHLYSILLWDEPTAGDAWIWPLLTRWSHSFTCHPLTNHTCLYSPAAWHHRRLAGTHYIKYLPLCCHLFHLHWLCELFISKLETPRYRMVHNIMFWYVQRVRGLEKCDRQTVGQNYASNIANVALTRLDR